MCPRRRLDPWRLFGSKVDKDNWTTPVEIHEKQRVSEEEKVSIE